MTHGCCNMHAQLSSGGVPSGLYVHHRSPSMTELREMMDPQTCIESPLDSLQRR
jgi:hypothetical protein